MDRLHEQDFAYLLVNVPSNIMQTRLHSCIGLGVVVWLLVYPTTPAFHLSLVDFFTTLCTCLGLPHLIVAHLSQC